MTLLGILFGVLGWFGVAQTTPKNTPFWGHFFWGGFEGLGHGMGSGLILTSIGGGFGWPLGRGWSGQDRKNDPKWVETSFFDFFAFCHFVIF